MPFPSQVPTPFTKPNIEALHPNQSGCYGIYSGNLCVYVGKGDIRTRLLDHFAGHGTSLASLTWPPTHFVTCVTPTMDTLEKALIIELKPVLNQKVG